MRANRAEKARYVPKLLFHCASRFRRRVDSGQRRSLSITRLVEISAEIPAAQAPEQRIPAIQVFELLPTFWRKDSGSATRSCGRKRQAPRLEAERDATANRATTRGHLRQYLAVFSARLNVEQVARIEYGFSADRQPKAR